MYLTVNDRDGDDPLKRRLARGDATILFNGKQVFRVTEAHEEEGFIVQYELDTNGRYIIDREAQEAKTIKLHGKVVIVDSKRK